MFVLLAAIVVAAAVVWAGARVAGTLGDARRDATQDRALQLLNTFAPAVAAAGHDPRAILTWQPLAAAARDLFPAEFALLDRSAGGRFPFNRDRLQEAHARWTTEWLAWERAHDAQFKLKAATVESELLGGSSPLSRAKLEVIEGEKLELYQRRYEEYVRISKALQALIA